MAYISMKVHIYNTTCFRFQGIECKEGTKLRDIPTNRKLLQMKNYWTNNSARRRWKRPFDFPILTGARSYKLT
jgi:hypothetical protein